MSIFILWKRIDQHGSRMIKEFIWNKKSDNLVSGDNFQAHYVQKI